MKWCGRSQSETNGRTGETSHPPAPLIYSFHLYEKQKRSLFTTHHRHCMNTNQALSNYIFKYLLGFYNQRQQMGMPYDRGPDNKVQMSCPTVPLTYFKNQQLIANPIPKRLRHNICKNIKTSCDNSLIIFDIEFKCKEYKDNIFNIVSHLDLQQLMF